MIITVPAKGILLKVTVSTKGVLVKNIVFGKWHT